MDSFEALFKRYGMSVSQIGNNSFVAENETWAVFYSPFKCGSDWLASAVSYLIEDKNEIITAWEKSNFTTVYHPTGIGFYCFSDQMSSHPKHLHMGGICNHDVAPWEAEYFLEKVIKKEKRKWQEN